MTVPVPKIAAGELWNRIIHLTRDDGVELDRINWQLRGLAARQPADFLARVAAATGLLRRGQKVDALQHMEAAWGMRHGRSFFEQSCFLSVLIDAGYFSMARDICDVLINRPEYRQDYAFCPNVKLLALRLGDIDLLRKASNLVEDGDEYLASFISVIEGTGLENALRTHQEIVESVLGQETCTFHAAILIDDEGEISANLQYYTGIQGPERFRLHERIVQLEVSAGIADVLLPLSIGISGPEVQVIEEAA